jgi:hypothetical protein
MVQQERRLVRGAAFSDAAGQILSSRFGEGLIASGYNRSIGKDREGISS